MLTKGCPYCGVKLEKVPKRKTACSDCGQLIFIRKGTMVTEYEAQKMDWLVYVENLSVNSKTIDLHREKLKERFGKTPQFNDICWSILNSLLSKFVRKYEKQKAIYFEMVRILDQEGRDSNELRKQIARMDLLAFKEIGVTHVSVFNCNDDLVCDECRKIENIKISVDDALIANLIPGNCINTHCRCWYTSHTEFKQEH